MLIINHITAYTYGKKSAIKSPYLFLHISYFLLYYIVCVNTSQKKCEDFKKIYLKVLTFSSPGAKVLNVVSTPPQRVLNEKRRVQSESF